MEAVPKVPMLHFTLKQTQQKSSFSRLKQYIAECYQEDPETFSKEIYELETLRAAAYNPSIDETGYNVIKRYYCQLHSLQNRFPIENDRNLVSFVWRDNYSNNTIQSTDLRHDMAVVLYNYGAIQTQLGASTDRTSEDDMKLVCTLFQRAAWAFETVRESYQMATTGDMYPEILIFMQNLCLAQAQECILEKSLIDNRKSIVVAKVASQIIEYYNTSIVALLSGGEEGIIAEIVGSKQFKEWRQYIQFKVEYTACILLLYQGQNSEEQQHMGERVTLYQAAFDRLEDARKVAKHLNNMSQVTETLTFVMDVVEAKRKAAKNENEFIYHEEVPELSSIASISGANLVKGIPFNVADSANEDIFHRLVPIKTQEQSSIYSEEKTNLLRKIAQKINAKDGELEQFMESLNVDLFSYNSKGVKLPQSIIDRCASMNARTNAIDDLIQNMSSLAEICVDVENVLQAIQELLSKEEFSEKDFQQTMGYRPSGHFIELSREFMKYQEAHNKAGDSNDTLRKAMEMHVNNLRILSKPLAEVQAAIPTCAVECDRKLLSDTQMLLSKVNEMRVQRAQIYEQLSENIQKDDITPQLVAWGENDVEKLFENELGKHVQLVNIIEQNLVAQENILKSFTDAYAKCAHFIKTVSETKHKRDIFFSSLIASYDVYDDLLGKSLKGLEFYKKLQSNIHKLFARVRSARDVHDEERQQRIESMNKKALLSNNPTVMPVTSTPMSTPIVEYPNSAKPTEYEVLDNYRSTAIRPTPIGQENTGIQTNQISHDISHSSLSSTTGPYNYNYQSTVSSITPSSQAQLTQSPIMTTGPVSSITSTYSSQPNAYYNTQYSQPNNYAPSSGYVNPIYNNISISRPSNQSKQGYGTENVSTNVMKTNISNAPVISSGVADIYTTTNPNIATSIPSGWVNSGNNRMMQSSASNITPNLHDQLQSQMYMNYAQNDPRDSYTSRPSATRDSTNPDMNLYQARNPTAISNTEMMQPTMYTNLSYSSANNQVNPYHMPSNRPYSQTQQQQTTQVSQIYSHSIPTTSYMQAPQQIPLTSAYTNYAQSYSTQPLSQPINVTSANDSKLTRPTNDAYTYYNNQYQIHNNPATNQYYGHDYQANMHNMPQGLGYLPTSYGPATSIGVPHQENVYNYAGNPQISPAINNYTTIQQQVQNPMTYTEVKMSTTVSSQPSTLSSVNNKNITTNQNVTAGASQLPATQMAKPKPLNLDLMSDLEYIPSIPAPTLQPITIKPEIVSQITIPESEATIKAEESEKTKSEILETTKIVETLSIDKDDSIEKALTEMSLDEKDFLVAKPKAKTEIKQNIPEITATGTTTISTANAVVPPSSANIENFYKEVQRYEKIVNGLVTKTLNGTTPLEIKWKELHDLLEKDANKRTFSVSKLFPEKNRNMLSVPYDHSRVLLPTETDNYINAAHVRDLGSSCNHFILADAPTFNTVKDFWCMIWSQQASYVVCLNTPDEGPVLLLPKQLNTAQIFGDYSITILTEQHRLYVIERSIQITSSETNATRMITILQSKQWPTKNSNNNIIGVSQNIIDIVTAVKMHNFPIILNCMTNLERSSLVALTITCILALESDTPTIINITDVWHRICSQRKNLLTDMNILQQSMQIVLQCCREFIKKRSPKTLGNNTQTNYYFIEEEESSVKDPFKDLDPLWKLK